MTAGPPPRRADAQRNRDALVQAAATLFVSHGVDVPLEAVAKQAGVSIATLYRNFATREALVSATYQDEIAVLANVESMLDGRSGADALAAWVARFVDYARTKRALADVLHALPAEARPAARGVVISALDRLLSAGAADGSLRTDMDAEDVLAGLAGLWSLPDTPDRYERSERLGSFVVEGLRRDR